MGRHPDHASLAEETRGWYTRPVPDMGYQVERGRYGFYQLHPASERAAVTVRDLEAGEVPELIADVRRYYDDRPVRIYVDDRSLDDCIGDALAQAGCFPESAEVFLAHVGESPEPPSAPRGLSVEEVGEENLLESVVTSIRGFESSEAEPERGEVEYRAALRRAELSGEGRLLLARLEGEPAAVLGLYEGEDRFVFNLATRVPFRRRGIAGRLLSGVISESKKVGCRSTIINAAEDGRPVRMYRALGFTDELYWRRKYRLGPR